MGKTKRRRAYQITWPKQQETSCHDETSSWDEIAVSGDKAAFAHTKEQEANFQNWLKEVLHSKGAEDLFGLISAAVEKEVAKLADAIKVTVAEECGRQKELYNCTRSVIIHNANQLVMDSGCVENGYSLVDQVISLLHNISKGSVLDAFIMGRRSEQPSTSVCIVLGPSRQKATVFRMLVRHMKSNTSKGACNVSLRDRFPRHHMDDVKKLVAKGAELKKAGCIVGYKVCSRGPAAVPTLEVKKWHGNKHQGKWEAYLDEKENENEVVDGKCSYDAKCSDDVRCSEDGKCSDDGQCSADEQCSVDGKGSDDEQCSDDRQCSAGRKGSDVEQCSDDGQGSGDEKCSVREQCSDDGQCSDDTQCSDDGQCSGDGQCSDNRKDKGTDTSDSEPIYGSVKRPRKQYREQETSTEKARRIVMTRPRYWDREKITEEMYLEALSKVNAS
jgi:hypothetical protein